MKTPPLERGETTDQVRRAVVARCNKWAYHGGMTAVEPIHIETEPTAAGADRSLVELPIEPHRHFVVFKQGDDIVLRPIPEREMLVWENESVRKSLLRGLADVAAGRVSRRDDYLAGDDDDE